MPAHASETNDRDEHPECQEVTHRDGAIIMKIWHGAHGGNRFGTGTPHPGQCWTSDAQAAETYAGTGAKRSLWGASLDLAPFIIERTKDYEHDEDFAIGDTKKSLAELRARGVDFVIYNDEDETGRSHDTIRIISDRAAAAVAATNAEYDFDDDDDDEDDEDDEDEDEEREAHE